MYNFFYIYTIIFYIYTPKCSLVIWSNSLWVFDNDILFVLGPQ